MKDKCIKCGVARDDSFDPSRNVCPDCRKKQDKARYDRMGDEIRRKKREYNATRKDEKREYNKKYFESNKNSLKQYKHKYNLEHKEEKREYNKKYHKNHAESLRIASRRRYKEIRERQMLQKKRHDESSPENFLARMIHLIRHSSKKRGIKFDLTKDVLFSVHDDQNGRCAITGLLMAHKFGSLYSMSLDRIDSSKGYLEDNVHLVCQGVNLMKRKYSVDDVRCFLKMCGQDHKPNGIDKKFLGILRINTSYDHGAKQVISKQDAYNLWDKQRGLCAITGVPLLCEWKKLNSASIDRIDPSGVHDIDNIQLVAQGINLMKNKHTNQEAIDFIEDIKRNLS